MCLVPGPSARFSDDPIGGAVDPVVAVRGDEFPDDLVVGLVAGQRIFQVRIEGVAALKITNDIGRVGVVLVKIAEEHRPLIDVLDVADEGVDDHVALPGVRVIREGADLFHRGRPAGEVEEQTSQELLVVRDRGGLDSVSLHPAEDVFVDKILPGHRLAIGGSSVTRNVRLQCVRDVVGPQRDLSPILLLRVLKFRWIVQVGAVA